MKKLNATAILVFVSILLTGQYAAAEVSEQELESISTPDEVRTSLGELKFFDSVPRVSGSSESIGSF